MQWFSWRTSTVGTAGANVECRRHELVGGSGGMPPGKFVKLDSLKCNFLRSLDRNWVTEIMTGIISLFFDCMHYISLRSADVFPVVASLALHY